MFARALPIFIAMIHPGEFYNNLLHNTKASYKKISDQRKWTGVLRLATFLAAVIILLLYFRGNLETLFPALIFLIVFLIAIRIDTRLQRIRNFLGRQIDLLQNELQIMEGRVNVFDPGNLYHSPVGFADDLDLFGNHSLYHLLNRCTTIQGQQSFAARLLNFLPDSKAIETYQSAIKSYTTQPELRTQVIAAGSGKQEQAGDMDSVHTWLLAPGKYYGKPIPNLLRVLLPIANLTTAYFWLSSGNYFPFLITASLTWLYLGSAFKYISLQHQHVGKKSELLNQYAGILQHFSKVNTHHSDLLAKLQKEAGQAHREFQKLATQSEMFDQRMNGVVFILLNTFFAFDLQIILSLEKWKRENKEHFKDWLNAVGEIEYLNTMATFAFNNPGYTYPVADERIQNISAMQMSHPLIPVQERVYNDFSLGESEQLILLTGSNMSGKSTFLRSLGINMILAQSGAPVCASSFTFKPCRLLTCIRVTDNLHEHTSYFMAELKKLQQIIRQLQQGAYSLVLIDEILRGTNSDDKHHGSERYIEKLLSYNCLSVFATHDVQLGQLATRWLGKISNYCFESTIYEDDIFFDYKLHTGISKNRNATFLMNKMEII